MFKLDDAQSAFSPLSVCRERPFNSNAVIYPSVRIIINSIINYYWFQRSDLPIGPKLSDADSHSVLSGIPQYRKLCILVIAPAPQTLHISYCPSTASTAY